MTHDVNELEKIWLSRSIVATDFSEDMQQAIGKQVVVGPDRWIMSKDQILRQVMAEKGVWVLRLFAPQPMFFYAADQTSDRDAIPIPNGAHCIKQGWEVVLEAPSFFEHRALGRRFYLRRPCSDWVEPIWAKLVAIHLMAMEVIGIGRRPQGRTLWPWTESPVTRPALLIALSHAREVAAREGMAPNEKPLITWVPEHEVAT